MDPNATLNALRELLAGDDGEVAETFAALDEWLSNGGFLPDDWRKDRDES